MKSKTIAIAGFSTTTLGALKHSSADEIWTLNHAFVMGFAFPRFDRVFELHKREWYLREGEFFLEKYDAWLKEPHPFPIYMHEVCPDVPASVRYPFEEVSENIFGKLLRAGERNLYYTSSFSYMMALAIYEQVARVEIYGIDMGVETEYNYQKPSGELMIGVALGRGIEVVLQPETPMCKAQLYGYDRVPAASKERAEALINLYREEHERTKLESSAFAKAYASGASTDTSAYMESSAYAAMNGGAADILAGLIQCNYFLGRQYLDNERRKARTQEERFLAEANNKKAVSDFLMRRGEDNSKEWTEYLNARFQMYKFSGARQAIQKLIDECDMKVVPDNLRMEIVDD